jgi:hypothetical protein
VVACAHGDREGGAPLVVFALFFIGVVTLDAVARGSAACWFANEYGESPIEFPQLGLNLTILEPGPSSVYHGEANQEAFLVSGR